MTNTSGLGDLQGTLYVGEILTSLEIYPGVIWNVLVTFYVGVNV